MQRDRSAPLPLKLEDKVGTMLPCNVVVQEAGGGRTRLVGKRRVACPEDAVVSKVDDDFLLERVLDVDFRDDAETFPLERVERKVEVYKSSFQLVNRFTVPSLPPVPPGTPAGQNWAPFNVQVLYNQLYVSYALQDAAHHDDVAGPGNGFVAKFDSNGNFISVLINSGRLNSPWGLDIAFWCLLQ